MAFMCRLLRHPAETITYASGTTVLRCPCCRIEVTTRAFPVDP
jgi:hypothetical protein